MDKSKPVGAPEKKQPTEKYHEPLLVKHEPLRDITGQTYGPKKTLDVYGEND
jgi:hypothetical protein